MKPALLAVLAFLTLAASAQAMSLQWSGDIAPGSDPQYSNLVIGGSTCASSSPQQFGLTQAYDAYAVRNTSGTADCVTVTLTAPAIGCVGTATYLGSFNPAAPLDGFGGARNSVICGSSSSAYQLTVPAGSTFVPLVFSNGTTGTYQIQVAGSSLAPADEVDAGGTLPKDNTFSLHASVLKNGTGAEGSVSVSSAAGKAYSGPVQCLRVDGDDATLIASITGGNQDPKYKGVVFWLHEGAPGTAGGQRNSLLTQAQLNRLFNCPDPGSKATNALSSGHTSVVDTPDPLVGIGDED